MSHLYATFTDASHAEKAAGALLDFGVRKEDITLVAHETHGTAAGTASAVGARVGDTAQSAGDRIAQAGDRVAGAVAGAVGAHGAAANYQAAGTAHAVQADTRSYSDAMDDDDSTVSGNSTDLAAKQGISTTTPEDAGAGAVKGTEIGLGLGILAGVASLLVPGVGLVLGGGALATAIGGAALTAGAGAVAGGVTGYLKEQGVPSEAVDHYQGAVENGGAILSLNIPSGDVDQTAAEQVLSKYGASNVNAY